MRHLVVVAIGAIVFGSATAQDPDAAERTYRVARRMVAEGSPEAEASLRRVIELDPSGAVADDARMDLADLAGVPRTVRELGRITTTGRDRALEWLDRVGSSGGARSAEALLRAALLRLEPLSERDVEGARSSLIAVAGSTADPDVAAAARSALAWIDAFEEGGDFGAAAWHRILTNDPSEEIRSIAAEGLARAHLRAGRFSLAAAALDGVPGADEAIVSLALREVLRGAGEAGGWSAERATTALTLDAPKQSMIARSPDGSILVLERRAGTVIEYARDGRPRERWSLPSPLAVTVDPYGRTWVVTETGVSRLAPGGAIAESRLGSFDAIASIAVDSAGRAWLLNRKGDRILRSRPGVADASAWWEDEERRLRGLVHDGVALLSVDEKSGDVIELGVDGSQRSRANTGVRRVEAIAIDPAGQLAVLDSRDGAVVLVGVDGRVRDRSTTRAVGITRPIDVAMGPDGSVDLLDAATGRVVRLR